MTYNIAQHLKKSCNAFIPNAMPSSLVIDAALTFLERQRQKAGGLWVGGTLTASPEGLSFVANDLNLAFHSALQPVFIPTADIYAISTEFGWISGTVIVWRRHGEFRLRCFKAAKLAVLLQTLLPQLPRRSEREVVLPEQPFLLPGQLERLIQQQSISHEQPWASNDEEQVEALYRSLCQEIMQSTGTLSRIEWNHYGSGYASFVDAWFYRPTPDFEAAHCPGYQGLAVLLCRLSPHYALMEGNQQWRADGSGSNYYPGFTMLDDLYTPAVTALAAPVQALLDRHGLRRLKREDLATVLPEGTPVPTMLDGQQLREFDALFYYED